MKTKKRERGGHALVPSVGRKIVKGRIA
ncbi:MAG: hypothetical protein QOJ87_1811, partial [Verrucomicrobiota bacterium]